MRRHDELHRPRSIGVQLRHERGRDPLELPDEDLLHLRVEVRLRLLDEDEVDAGRRRRRLVLPEETQQLQEHVHEISRPQPVVGLGERHAVDAPIPDPRVVLEELVHVEARLGYEPGIRETGVSEQVERRQ